MKKSTTKAICSLFFGSILNINAQVSKVDNNTSVFFQENKGQICDQNYKSRPDILFSGNTNGINYHLTNKGISYQLNRIDHWKET